MRAAEPSGRARGLPAELTPFVGRRGELADVRGLLSASRLVTLTGVGGVGKTRLAHQVAATLTRAFRDGIHVVELAGLRDPGLLVETVAAALGLRDQSAPLTLDVLAEHLGGRRVLLVVDNCEHLATECATALDALLRAAPGLRALATSRHVLGITGEQTYEVAPFPVPSPDHAPTAAELSGCHSAILFEQRAAAVLPGFRIDGDNAAAVGRLLHRLDGLPLALELAAARMRTLTPGELLDRLDDRFAVLTGGSRAAPPRQRTLRELMDWSYDLCSPQERTLWARASVFAGGFDLEAAEAVCSGADLARSAVADLVHALVEKSVLTRSPAGEEDGRARYRMLETVREYGQGRLVGAGSRAGGPEGRAEPGARPDALAVHRRRHRDHCLDLVRRAQREWFGPGQIPWLTRLRRDHANLRAALDFCLSTPGEQGAGRELASLPHHYWISHGALSEGRHWLARLLDTGEDEPTRLAALGTYAYLGVLQGAGAAAVEEYEALAERLQDASALAWARHHRALLAFFGGEPERGTALLAEAVARHRAAGDLTGVAECTFKRAIVETLLGHTDLALALCRESQEITAAHGESWTRADALFAESLVRRQTGDRCRADALARDAVRLLRPLGDRWGIALCVEVLAWSAADGADPERAACLLGVLRTLWESVGGTFFVAPFMRVSHDRCERDTRAALSPRDFDRALRRGAALSLADALTYVLEEPAPTTPPPEPYARTSLTRREREVADLVAAGLANAEIAATLVIARRTAETHVGRVLTKLGLTSRSQLAAWVHDNRDAPGKPVGVPETL
ncbi:ATP-binding protein [Streptomyces sp. NPDC057877]|uniref:ATP-binding protein n=1 Tax=Streptomyces sp. NPDC057877 TaxID=3346269 RepID=UPI0036A873ED